MPQLSLHFLGSNGFLIATRGFTFLRFAILVFANALGSFSRLHCCLDRIYPESLINDSFNDPIRVWSPATRNVSPPWKRKRSPCERISPVRPVHPRGSNEFIERRLNSWKTPGNYGVQASLSIAARSYEWPLRPI